MGTETALAKLTQMNKSYLNTQVDIANHSISIGLKTDEFSTGKIRGYLDCLCNIGMISGTETRALCLYYLAKIKK